MSTEGTKGHTLKEMVAKSVREMAEDMARRHGKSQVEVLEFCMDWHRAAVAYLEEELGRSSFGSNMDWILRQLLVSKADFAATEVITATNGMQVMAIVAQGPRGCRQLEKIYKRVPGQALVPRSREPGDN